MSLIDNFLTGFFGSDGYMKDFAHASRLYRDDNLYDLAPKAGWLYYVRLGINIQSIKRVGIESAFKTWTERFSPFVGLLAKSAEQPKFSIATETLNQYNRKTVIQTRLNYQPLTITFHDDMANAVTDLWKAYYTYYFADGRAGLNASLKNSKIAEPFMDNKYEPNSYSYGLANYQNEPFFSSIEIYLLNKQKFSSVTLLNPIIKEWAHSQVEQNTSRFLDSRMTVEYESVIYNQSQKGKKSKEVGFTDNHYDNTPSPLSVAGGGSSTLFGPGGVINGASEVFGDISSINETTSPLDIVGIGLKAANVANNLSKINVGQALKTEGYSILTGTLNEIGKVGVTNYSEQISRDGLNIGGLQITGNGGFVNTFRQYYNSSNGSQNIKSDPVSLAEPPPAANAVAVNAVETQVVTNPVRNNNAGVTNNVIGIRRN